jgi:large subunit ribosomal protein L21
VIGRFLLDQTRTGGSRAQAGPNPLRSRAFSCDRRVRPDASAGRGETIDRRARLAHRLPVLRGGVDSGALATNIQAFLLAICAWGALARPALGSCPDMYAVIRTGGKQYRVASGQVVKIERLAGEVGDTVAFDQVLMIGHEQADGEPTIGAPLIDGARVTAEVLEQGKGPKVIVFKKKRRKNYRRRRGHRQLQTVLRIRDIAVA